MIDPIAHLILGHPWWIKGGHRSKNSPTKNTVHDSLDMVYGSQATRHSLSFPICTRQLFLLTIQKVVVKHHETSWNSKIYIQIWDDPGLLTTQLFIKRTTLVSMYFSKQLKPPTHATSPNFTSPKKNRKTKKTSDFHRNLPSNRPSLNCFFKPWIYTPIGSRVWLTPGYAATTSCVSVSCITLPEYLFSHPKKKRMQMFSENYHGPTNKTWAKTTTS